MKVGSLVKCITDEYNEGHLTVGRIYEILRVDGTIVLVNDDRLGTWWVNDTSFILVNPPLPPELLTQLRELNSITYDK